VFRVHAATVVGDDKQNAGEGAVAAPRRAGMDPVTV
jgi:hypothetical protein